MILENLHLPRQNGGTNTFPFAKYKPHHPIVVDGNTIKKPVEYWLFYYKLYFKLKIIYLGCTLYCEFRVENCEKLSSFSDVVFNKLVAATLYSQ